MVKLISKYSPSDTYKKTVQSLRVMQTLNKHEVEKFKQNWNLQFK